MTIELKSTYVLHRADYQDGFDVLLRRLGVPEDECRFYDSIGFDFDNGTAMIT